MDKLRNLGRAGFTLIELLVVLAIAGVLAGLAFGAVQKVRDSANRVSCANNLREIGLGLLQHVDMFQVLPSNGGWDGSQTINSTSGTATVIYTQEPTLPPYYWGVGDATLTPQQQTGCWAYSILPFMDQGNMWQERAWTSPVKSYICPARRDALALPPPMSDEYAAYNGGGWAWGKIDYAANALTIPGRPDCLMLNQITDGTSETVLVAEKAMDPLLYNTGSWFWDEPFFAGGDDGNCRSGAAVMRDTPGSAYAARQNWGSAHATGAQFLFADGSVHLLSFGTAPGQIQALMTPSAGEVITLDY